MYVQCQWRQPVCHSVLIHTNRSQPQWSRLLRSIVCMCERPLVCVHVRTKRGCVLFGHTGAKARRYSFRIVCTLWRSQKLCGPRIHANRPNENKRHTHAHRATDIVPKARVFCPRLAYYVIIIVVWRTVEAKHGWRWSCLVHNELARLHDIQFRLD